MSPKGIKMYTINQYYKEILAFTNTLTVKFLDVGIAMNNGVIAAGGAVTTDKKTWKYFLNISGLKHATNSDVKVTVIETGNLESLTIELLDTYTYTKKELLKGSNFYHELLLKYPNDTLYIKGCLYPANIDTAVSAKDGTILSYDSNYIEASEYRLIAQLQEYIISYLNRWHVRAYTIVDELYLASMLGNLFASIPNKIINIRLSAINSNEVHSFHLEHFFRSRLNLWNEVQALNPATRYWLYKNLDYLIKHVGKEATFQTILTKIFDENNVGVGEYLLKIPDPVSNPDAFKIAALEFFKPNNVITSSVALNSSFTVDSEEDFSLDHLVNVEMTKIPDALKEENSDKIAYITNDVKEITSKQANDTFKTKAITLGTTKLFKMNGVDLTTLAISYWLYYIKNNWYNTIVDYNEPNIIVTGTNDTTVDYVEPNSNQYFSVSPKVGFLLLLKQLLYVTGQQDMKLSKLTFTHVMSSDLNRFIAITNNIYQDYYSKELFRILKDELPTTPVTINDPVQLGEYIAKIVDYYRLTWVLDSNSESSAASANIKQLMSHMALDNTYDLTEAGFEYTIDELLAQNNVSYTITDNFDLTLSISTILKAFTNITIDEYETIKERMQSYTSILNKLTSYTLQVINASVDDDTLFSYYNNNSVLHTDGGLMLVLDSTLEPLEYEYVKICATGNDFRERLRAQAYTYSPMITVCELPIKGVAELDTYSTEIRAINFIPVATVHISSHLLCDITPLLFKDEFLTGVTATFSPYESFTGGVEALTSDFRDCKAAFVDADIYIVSAMLDEQPIIGLVEIDDLTTNDIVSTLTQPSATVTIEGTFTYELDK